MRTGRPRPVLIEVPPEAAVEREEVVLRNPARISRTVPSPEQLEEAAQVIANSRLPLIYAGGGVAISDAEQALVKLAEATNIPVVTSNGGKGTIPDSHPLSYGSCFSPRAERQEMNQLFEVMQSADVVIGIGARFSLGNPAGEASTLININIDDAELTRIQANTIPLHGDAKATIEALIPYLVEAKAGDRSSPAAAVTAARNLIHYYDINLEEPAYEILETIKTSSLMTHSSSGTSPSSRITPGRTIKSTYRRPTSTLGTHSTSDTRCQPHWAPRSRNRTALSSAWLATAGSCSTPRSYPRLSSTESTS